MMQEIAYSVLIRTTGKAGEKYQKLLDAVSALEPQPQEVIVVLPEGYEPPAERLGWERFCFCPKGMVLQRITGIRECRTRYALICDDDVCFPPDFVKKLHAPLKNGAYGFSAGPLLSFLPTGKKQILTAAMMGAAVPTVFHKERYISVLRSAGYSYNRNIERERSGLYEAQSLAWTCFFADLEAYRRIGFEAESWLDAHGYSAMDDQTMFYKAWLRGVKTVVVSDAEYQHMDARTSVRGNRPAAVYSSAFNRIVFWHRFIYTQETGLGKAWSGLCFGYRQVWEGIYRMLDVVRRRSTRDDLGTYRNGCRAAWRYLRTAEYAALPPVQ